jgi:hypothetical protein
MKRSAVDVVNMVHIYPTGLKQVNYDVVSSIVSCKVQGRAIRTERVGFFWVRAFFFHQTLHFDNISMGSRLMDGQAHHLGVVCFTCAFCVRVCMYVCVCE